MLKNLQFPAIDPPLQSCSISAQCRGRKALIALIILLEGE